MTSEKIPRVACALALFAFIAGVGFAQPLDKRTFFTFSGPIALPGVTLPAGQYLFRLADSGSSRSVVQVLSADGRTPYAMFFTLRAERRDPSSVPEVHFMETASGMPSAVATWWYPGEPAGYEFVYPKEQARRLARGVTEPVLTTQVETTTVEETKVAELERISPSGAETKVSLAPSPVPATPPGPALTGEVASPSIAILATPVPAQSARALLPRTGSAIPLAALVGVLSLLGAAGIRCWRMARG